MRCLSTFNQVLMVQVTMWEEFMEQLEDLKIIETTSIFTFGLVLISLLLLLRRDYTCISTFLMEEYKRWSLRC